MMLPLPAISRTAVRPTVTIRSVLPSTLAHRLVFLQSPAMFFSSLMVIFVTPSDGLRRSHLASDRRSIGYLLMEVNSHQPNFSKLSEVAQNPVFLLRNSPLLSSPCV